MTQHDRLIEALQDKLPSFTFVSQELPINDTMVTIPPESFRRSIWFARE